MKLQRTKHKEKYRLGWFYKSKRFFGSFGFLYLNSFGIWGQNQRSFYTFNIDLLLIYFSIHIIKK